MCADAQAGLRLCDSQTTEDSFLASRPILQNVFLLIVYNLSISNTRDKYMVLYRSVISMRLTVAQFVGCLTLQY